MLMGRLLIACLFFHVAHYELLRITFFSYLPNVDPDDPHNVRWPKIMEFLLAVPLVLGYRTAEAARCLAATPWRHEHSSTHASVFGLGAPKKRLFRSRRFRF